MKITAFLVKRHFVVNSQVVYLYYDDIHVEGLLLLQHATDQRSKWASYAGLGGSQAKNKRTKKKQISSERPTIGFGL